MTSLEEQATEWEVLDSIYEGDDAFQKLDDNRLQYRIDGEKSFMIEVEWPPDYPMVRAEVSLEMYGNRHIPQVYRSKIRDALHAVADENVGMAVSYLLIEHSKEHAEEWAAEWGVDTKESSGVTEETSNREDEKKTEALSKAAKRKMWDRVLAGGGGERERGFDWVDILKHLSQTRDN